MIQLLVFCLDAADLTHWGRHGGPSRWPTLGRALRHAMTLRSTVVPQTPVAWTTFLCGAPPEETGVWGWSTVRGGRVTFVARDSMPGSWRDWSVPTLFAGMPLTPDDDGRWGRSLQGLGGARPMGGASRPAHVDGRDAEAATRAWQAHHQRWVEEVVQAAAGHEIVFVHCDAVDWFSHRWGPTDENAARGWSLGDTLLEALWNALGPARVVVVSDHGSATVTRVVRIHDALHRAGFARHPVERLASVDDVLQDPVYCISDYGALWCRDPGLVEGAAAMLRQLGARHIHRVASALDGAPTLVPEFEDGSLILIPPELYPEFGAGDVVSASTVREALRRHHWVGDHSRHGLVGASDDDTWRRLRGATIDRLKPALLAAVEA